MMVYFTLILVGILESIRICLEGYPTKKLYKDFYDRFKIICPESNREQDVKKACEIILQSIGIEKEKYQFGSTKIFLRASQIERIERARMARLNQSAIQVQKNIRRMIWHKRYKQTLVSISLLQVCLRQFQSFDHYLLLKKTHHTEMVQRIARVKLVKHALARETKCALVIQQKVREHLAKKKLKLKKREMATLTLVQAAIRGYHARKVYAEQLFQLRSLEALKNEKAGLELRVAEMEFKLVNEEKTRNKIEESAKNFVKELENKSVEIKSIKESYSVKMSELNNENHALKTQIEVLKATIVKLELEYQSLVKSRDELDLKHSTLVSQVEDTRIEMKSKVDVALSEIEKLKLELAKEKQLRSQAESKLNSMVDEKVRLKNRKEHEMAYDIQRALSAFQGDVQEKAERFVIYVLFENQMDFCNTIPAPAFMLYHLTRFAVNHELDYERISTLILNSVEAAIRVRNHNGVFLNILFSHTNT